VKQTQARKQLEMEWEMIMQHSEVQPANTAPCTVQKSLLAFLFFDL